MEYVHGTWKEKLVRDMEEWTITEQECCKQLGWVSHSAYPVTDHSPGCLAGCLAAQELSDDEMLE